MKMLHKDAANDNRTIVAGIKKETKRSLNFGNSSNSPSKMIEIKKESPRVVLVPSTPPANANNSEEQEEEISESPIDYEEESPPQAQQVAEVPAPRNARLWSTLSRGMSFPASRLAVERRKRDRDDVDADSALLLLKIENETLKKQYQELLASHEVTTKAVETTIQTTEVIVDNLKQNQTK